MYQKMYSKRLYQQYIVFAIHLQFKTTLCYVN